MTYGIFDCGLRSCRAPLNPIGEYQNHSQLRAASQWLQSLYVGPNSSGDRWVSNAACKWVDNRAPRCCPPPKNYHAPEECCNY